jgi:hypothetical protein
LDTNCVDKRIATTPIIATLPNGSTISSTHEATLPFPDLPAHALLAHIFPDLHGHALLSIGTFCDAGCTATFSATEVTIDYQGRTVLTGTRDPPGLWKTTQQPTTATTEYMANGAYSSQLKSNAVKFLHAACFSPTTSTWTKAINHGFFRSWPMLTAKTVRQHLPKSVATAMGHMDQSRKNQRSIKLRSKPTQDEDGWITPASRRFQPPPHQDLDPQPVIETETTATSEVDAHDNTPTAEQPTNIAFANMIELSNVDGKSYTDITGRFPCKSELGNLYVMVLYAYNANAILVEPIKNRSDSEQLKAMDLLINRANKGTKLKVQWMDNEASTAIKQLLQDKFGMLFQLTPPHMHRINAAERDLQEPLRGRIMFYGPIFRYVFGIDCCHRPRSP